MGGLQSSRQLLLCRLTFKSLKIRFHFIHISKSCIMFTAQKHRLRRQARVLSHQKIILHQIRIFRWNKMRLKVLFVTDGHLVHFKTQRYKMQSQPSKSPQHIISCVGASIFCGGHSGSFWCSMLIVRQTTQRFVPRSCCGACAD